LSSARLKKNDDGVAEIPFIILYDSIRSAVLRLSSRVHKRKWQKYSDMLYVIQSNRKYRSRNAAVNKELKRIIK